MLELNSPHWWSRSALTLGRETTQCPLLLWNTLVDDSFYRPSAVELSSVWNTNCINIASFFVLRQILINILHSIGILINHMKWCILRESIFITNITNRNSQLYKLVLLKNKNNKGFLYSYKLRMHYAVRLHYNY